MPAYSRRDRRRLPSTLARTFAADTVVIWEGIVAVELARLVGALERSVHLDSREPGRRQRVLQHYANRGMADAGPGCPGTA